MARNKSIWFRIGHALERARGERADAARTVRGLSERRDADDRERPRSRALRRGDPSPLPSADDLIATGIALVVDRALGSWGKRSEPGFTRLLRAGAAGAAAALVIDVVRPLLEGDRSFPAVDGETADRMLAGFGQGLVYGAVVEPRVPGPSVLKGALYGSVEYAVDPMGGLSGLLGSHTPQRKLPVVGGLFDGLDAGERAYIEHLAFGITLALLYGSSPSSNGIRPEEE